MHAWMDRLTQQPRAVLAAPYGKININNKKWLFYIFTLKKFLFKKLVYFNTIYVDLTLSPYCIVS